MLRMVFIVGLAATTTIPLAAASNVYTIDKWETATNRMIEPQREFEMVYIPTLGERGTVMVAGGRGGGQFGKDYTETGKNEAGQSVGQLSPSIDMYDAKEKAWRNGAEDIWQSRLLFGMVFVPMEGTKGTVMAAGGWQYTGLCKGVVYDSARIYSVERETWSDAAAMPEARRGFGMVYIPNVGTMVAGGYTWVEKYKFPKCAKINKRVLDSVIMYDAKGDSWRSVAAMPTELQNFEIVFLPSAASSAGTVMVAGGTDSTNAALSSVYMYDVNGNAWSTATAMPDARKDFGMVYISDAGTAGTVMVAGGFYYNNADNLPAEDFDSVFMYDVDGDVWSVATSMPGTRYNFGMAYIPGSAGTAGTVMVAGGMWHGPGSPAYGVDTVYFSVPATTTSSSSTTTTTTPTPTTTITLSTTTMTSTTATSSSLTSTTATTLATVSATNIATKSNDKSNLPTKPSRASSTTLPADGNIDAGVVPTTNTTAAVTPSTDESNPSGTPNSKRKRKATVPVVVVVVLLLLLAGGWWWFVACRHRKSQRHGNADDAVEESIGMMDNPMRAAATARAASFAENGSGNTGAGAGASANPSPRANILQNSIYNIGVPTPAQNRRRTNDQSVEAAAPPAPAPPAVSAATYSTVGKYGDVIYVSGGASSTTATNNAEHQQQQNPQQGKNAAVIYAVPHANRIHINASFNSGDGAAASSAARYSGYEAPAGAASSGSGGSNPIIYSIPMEEDDKSGSGDTAGAGGGRVPNPMYQSADPRNSTVVRPPNPMYQPAANNTYDAGVTTTTTTTSNDGGSGYYDADSVPNAANVVYATPVDGDDADEAKNLPNLVQVYGDDNGYDSDADGYGGTAA